MTTLVTTAHGNGRSPTWRWLAGVAVGILLTIGGYLYAQTQRRIERGEDTTGALRELVTMNSGVLGAQGGRLTVLEARLTRIEDKLDRALERVMKR